MKRSKGFSTGMAGFMVLFLMIAFY